MCTLRWDLGGGQDDCATYCVTVGRHSVCQVAGVGLLVSISQHGYDSVWMTVCFHLFAHLFLLSDDLFDHAHRYFDGDDCETHDTR